METCPSCNLPVDQASKYCNECGYKLVHTDEPIEMNSGTGRSYRLRSPILESAALYDDRTEKKHGMLLVLSYIFWLFAVAFIIFGAIGIYKNYTIDILGAVKEASMLFVLALVCFVIPGILNILIDIEDNLSNIVREAKKDRVD